jgi:biopolymer transport protein ExbD
MTAMCDVAFLLLTFFMLATKFKPQEPVVVRTPSSISDFTLPDKDILLLTVDAKGRIYFSVDNKTVDGNSTKQSLIEQVNHDKDLNLTKEEERAFVIDASEAIPLSQLKSYLDATPEQQKTLEQNAPGIPVDTSVTSPKNDLAEWILAARETNARLRICIKADGDASYPSVQKIIKTLAGYKIFSFSLITNLKGIPVGTAAYAEAAAAKKP